MMKQKDLLFKAGNAPSGTPWKPLSPLRSLQQNAKATKSKSEIKKLGKSYTPHKILNDTGTLKNSVSVRGAGGSVQGIDGDEVTLGTNVPYAAIQNFGGTIIPKNGKTLAFPGLGGAMIFAKKVTIPARPFIGINQTDEEDFSDVINAHMKRVTSGE